MPAAVKAPAQNPNAFAVEQTKEYTIRMGRYRGQALANAADVLWARVIEVMHKCREPITHHSNFVKTKVSEAELLVKGNTLAQLVCGKAEEIQKEFNEIQSAPGSN